MNDLLKYLVLGLANGAVYASLGLALVMTFRSSGVVNFATGTQALLTADVYIGLREGKFILLFPGFGKSTDIGGDPGMTASIVLSLLFAAVFGLLLYLIVFRPLRTAPPVAKAVASIGVMVLLGELLAQQVGTRQVATSAIFPQSFWHVGNAQFNSNRVYFAVTIVVISLVVAALYRFTRFGLITRAAAETEKGAYVSGIRPERLAAANWMISSIVAGIAGILIASIIPALPVQFTLLIVPALAAALLGQFQYMLPAVAGGLAIGMLQSVGVQLHDKHKWLPSSGLSELITLALILIVLVVRAKPLPSRGAVIQQTLGRAPRPHSILKPAVPATVVAVVALVVMSGVWRSSLLTSLIFAIIALSLVVVTGYCGQISLAQLTLAGVAGFSLSTITVNWNVPFPIAPLLAAGFATVVGVVVGLPALRIRGLPVAVVTLALGATVEALWFRNLNVVPSGGKHSTPPKFLGIDLNSGIGTTAFPRLQFCFLVLFVLVVVAIGVAKLRTSRLGSQMLAVRANERSAAGSGIDVVRVKLAAFALGAFIAGLGGAMLAYDRPAVTFADFTILSGIALFATVYLAGITSVSGGILAGLLAAGGLVFHAADQWLDIGDWYQTLLGVGLVLTVVLNPEGIMGPIHLKLTNRRLGEEPPEHKPVLLSEPTRPLAARPPGRTLLALQDVRVQYGGVVAVDNVSFNITSGSIVGLIGPNGAGKTTLVDAITGFASSSGSVIIAGKTLTGMAPHQRVRAGLGRTFQHAELYEDLSVTENVSVGLAGAGRRKAARDLSSTFELLDLAEVAERPVSELSQGRRQLVSIARALVAGPDLLLLDEPAGGLDSTESMWLGERLHRIRESGVTVLMIDHDMNLVLNVCDEIQVLDFGRIIASGPPNVIKTDRKVTAAYLGSTHAEKPVST